MRKRGKLDIYSHFVRFYDFDQQTREAFRYFLRQKLIAKQLVKEMGKWVKKDGKLFCFTSKDKREIRFHINVFAQLSEHLRSFSVDVENDFDKTTCCCIQVILVINCPRNGFCCTTVTWVNLIKDTCHDLQTTV